MRRKTVLLPLILSLLVTLPLAAPVTATDDGKPIIVCTTSAVGSVVRAYLGASVDIVVLVQPGLCPADFDMKPSDVYAVSHAAILFKQSIPGEFWLPSLLAAAGNPNLTQVVIPGDYTTPQGARNYIEWVGGNLSRILALDLTAQTAAMVADVEAVYTWIAAQAQALQAASMKVICMQWLRPFIASMGYQVVATYNPPETLSAGDIAALLSTAASEKVNLIVDNLQIDVEFGGGIAAQVGAQHVVLTNFPGALPGTENLTQMIRYNAEQLFNATSTWTATAAMKAELADLRTQMEDLRSQITLYQITTTLAGIAAAVAAVYLYVGRKRP